MTDTQLLINTYYKKAASFLKEMITIPAITFEEGARADFIEKYLKDCGVKIKRVKNNIIAYPPTFETTKQTLLLCAHLDTVPPSSMYTFDPHNPPFDEERIYGLGSNDDGGCLSALLHTFLLFCDLSEEYKKLNINLLLAISAEEERSGPNGMRLIYQELKESADFAIIGEPTEMKAAIAERGLLVIDALSEGVSGHAAREEGINAIYTALEDIATLQNYHFPKLSPSMGEVKITVTQINGGTQHNIIPNKCSFVVDIRTTEQYSSEEIFSTLSNELKSTLKARSLSNRSSATPKGHRLITTCETLGIEQFVSPTTSDWIVIDIPAIKMGVGDSSRSHRADEYILKEELYQGIKGYIDFIKAL